VTGKRRRTRRSSSYTEILRNQLYDAMYRGEDIPVNLVVLDEAHYLGDQDRGVVWEEVMIYLPRRVRLLSSPPRSPTQPRSPVARMAPPGSVPGDIRPGAPVLSIPVHVSQRRGDPLHQARNHGRKGAAFRRAQPEERLTPRQGWPTSPRSSGPGQLNLLPAIFFLKSRSDCNLAIQAALPREEPETDEERQRFTVVSRSFSAPIRI